MTDRALVTFCMWFISLGTLAAALMGHPNTLALAVLFSFAWAVFLMEWLPRRFPS